MLHLWRKFRDSAGRGPRRSAWDSIPPFSALEGLTALGQFEPGKGVTLFNPLDTGNEVPEATLQHEHIHRELTRATTTGLMLEVLYLLARQGMYVAEATLCYQQQWVVQEGCATYAGLCLVAHRRPDYLSEAIDRLPSGHSGQPPYREAFELFSRVLPVQRAPMQELQAQMALSLAIGHLAMNTDC